MLGFGGYRKYGIGGASGVDNDGLAVASPCSIFYTWVRFFWVLRWNRFTVGAKEIG